MEEYSLTPDQLIAKDFRVIQSSRRRYHPYGKSEWIAAIKKAYKRYGNVFAGYSKTNTRIYTNKVSGCSVIGTRP
jgi:hypothetical protein